MLTADRPEYARRAVAAFTAQTYPLKRLIIWETTVDPNCGFGRSHGYVWDGTDGMGCAWISVYHRCLTLSESIIGSSGRVIYRAKDVPGAPIGTLRNLANERSNTDILIHWDDDDYSHPNRIAEQVALLQSSGADVVGYREMLFWRESTIGDLEYALTQAQALQSDRSRDEILTRLAASLEISKGEALARFRKITEDSSCGRAIFSPVGEAWLYSNPDPRYCLGTSLCYWRKTWEQKPFEATSQGEDIRFCTGLDCVGFSSLIAPNGIAFTDPMKPKMIARIHSGNTSTVYRPELMAAIERQGGEWKRSPEWDWYCRATMEEK